MTTTAKKTIYQTPAGSTHLTSCCNSWNGPLGDGARWYAVGDPAAAIDPLTSQGIVTSMKMGSFIGDVISEKPLLLELETEVEAEDEDADVNVDPAEFEKMSTKMDAMPADPMDKISVAMTKMRYEREKERFVIENWEQVSGRVMEEEEVIDGDLAQITATLIPNDSYNDDTSRDTDIDCGIHSVIDQACQCEVIPIRPAVLHV
ncbi:hypothetical protein K435DRAFT_807755 [Dendrothele bispora CBS 962.96]|uniref:Uncharacterized protein n=1 Tax=Dendrothele bispora (strain CBS 962.96) TaxID=1314807 RepID=A0A4S8L405_DENBC|nr:hypothetical protein K435DRAFT_807755 [Dendrothele bispora CBS 962.96]